MQFSLPRKSTARGDYKTTATDGGPVHTITPALCIGSDAPDADNGILQNVDATADDADDIYGTKASTNGPFHMLTKGPRLGTRVDSETDGRPSTDAYGDDLNNDGAPNQAVGICRASDDEDGVVISTQLVIDDVSILQVYNGSTSACLLNGRVHFNGNSAFEVNPECLSSRA